VNANDLGDGLVLLLTVLDELRLESGAVLNWSRQIDASLDGAGS